jgi:tRNA uridine 5-carboxymethylaminomethyl modification enzyme
MARLSTSTAPRLEAKTVNTKGLIEQPGDPKARPFSVLSGPPRNLVSCFLTYTNSETHRLVRDNIKCSKIYADDPVSAGPRYCPSLEDKVRRFPHRERHHIFLEPDGPDLIYPSGMPTGLSPEVQQALINTILGLEETNVARPGYAIEYDICDPTYLEPTLESRLIKGLFMAGQINGTSGYEEAAAQGLWAGVGAALRASGREPMALGRERALTGVMLDDLTVYGVTEPYRMFTSRSEWRLSLREDNADLRLSPLADSLGLLDSLRRSKFLAKKADLELFGQKLMTTKITPSMAYALKDQHNLPDRAVYLSGTVSAAEFLRRPDIGLKHLYGLVDGLAQMESSAALTLETEIKYQGYLTRQASEMRQVSQREHQSIPMDLDFRHVPGLSGEATEILMAKKPSTLGQAGRLRGVTPAAVAAVMIHLTKSMRR